MAASSKDLKQQQSRSVNRAVRKVKTRQRCVVNLTCCVQCI